ncbi:hypothetical protein SEVIR_1G177830v4 [Setaria viridis]
MGVDAATAAADQATEREVESGRLSVLGGVGGAIGRGGGFGERESAARGEGAPEPRWSGEWKSVVEDFGHGPGRGWWGRGREILGTTSMRAGREAQRGGGPAARR